MCVDVEDSGCGLTPDQIARLFRPFEQVHDPPWEAREGTGLGLFITKGIVEQHGGTVTCESDGPGRGTTFTFTLPLAGPTAPGPDGEGDGAATRA